MIANQQIDDVFRLNARRQARTQQRSQENANRQRSGDLYQNVAAPVVDDGAGRGRDSDHEIRRRRGHHQRNIHEDVHHRNFDGAAADAEQAGESARDQRRAQPERIALRLVRWNHGLAVARRQEALPSVFHFAAAQQNGDRAVQQETGKESLQRIAVEVADQICRNGRAQ